MLRDGQTCRSRSDKFIPKQKLTGSTEVAYIIQEGMRVKEATEEHLFCGAHVDKFLDSAVPEGSTRLLKRRLDLNFLHLLRNNKSCLFFPLFPRTIDLKWKPSLMSFLLLWNLFKSVRMLEMMKAFTKVSLRRRTILGIHGSYLSKTTLRGCEAEHPKL